MNFVSTRGASPTVGLSTTIAAGLASDGGLYVPETLPHFEPHDFANCESLVAIANRLLAPFFADDELATQLPNICAEAFTFAAPMPALATPEDFVLELFHGPTAAFKDFGARFLAACMQRLSRKTLTTILVATSGDTGVAVAAAFHGIPNFRVVILYPDGRVSPRQAHQLGCYGDNVQTLRVAGTFDDCQKNVKQALGDVELQSHVSLSSANSISVGRLLPQMVYYAQASLTHWRAHSTQLSFVIPTGNLGNAFACILARACGLPIGRIALATNANATLHDFFAGKGYTSRASIATLANAMDVGAPSNFERLRWLYPDENRLRREFAIDTVSDDAIQATIRGRYIVYGEIFCPHTATAIRALEALRQEGAYGTWVAVSTAHPSKFDSIVEPLINRPVPVPLALAELLTRPSTSEPLSADYRSLKNYLVR